jgi:hypothetical protein
MSRSGLLPGSHGDYEQRPRLCRYEASQHTANYRVALCLSSLHVGQEFNGHGTNPVRGTLTNAETITRGPPTEPRSNVSCQDPQLQTAICQSLRQLHAHIDLICPCFASNTHQCHRIKRNLLEHD